MKNKLPYGKGPNFATQREVACYFRFRHVTSGEEIITGTFSKDLWRQLKNPVQYLHKLSKLTL